MKKSPLISICIPTYNRAPFLKEAIESIISQVTDNIKDLVEVCISDNASKDETQDLIYNYQKTSPIPIKYQCNEQNLGPDRNILKVIKMATGEYCWLLGDDDRIEKGGIKMVIDKIEENKQIDFFILTQNTYSFDFSNKIESFPQKRIKKKKFESDYIFNENIEFISNPHIMHEVTYMSILVFKKEKWDNAKGEEKILDLEYIHVYKIFKMVKDGAKVMYIRKEAIGWRSGNEYPLKPLERIKMDIENLNKISSIVFDKNSKEHRIITNQILDTYLNCRRTIYTKAHLEEIKSEFELMKLFFIYYSSFTKFWLKLFPVLIIPSFFWKFVYFIYKNTIKKLKNRKDLNFSRILKEFIKNLTLMG